MLADPDAAPVCRRACTVGKKKKSTITGAQRLLRNVDGGIREAHRMQDRHKRSAHVPTVHVRIQASGMRVWSARKTRGSPLLLDSGALVAANSRLARMPPGQLATKRSFPPHLVLLHLHL